MLKNLIITILVFLPIDLVWLGLVAKNLYEKELGAFERIVRWGPALLVYLVIPLGLAVFAMPKVDSLRTAVMWGGLYGFVVYATYDLTNYAVLAKWPLKITIIDILWGTTLSAITALIVYLLMRSK